MIPILKPTVSVNIIDKNIYIRSSGETKIIADDTGLFRSLINSFDGIKNVAQISKHLLKSYPIADLQYTESLISDLNAHLLLENIEYHKETSLTPYELERWQRNINFFGSFCSLQDNKYFFQEKIKEAKVALLGLGGLGTHILFDLASLGVQKINIVDFDGIELSNLNRQILYKEKDIGSNKAYKAKERIQEFSKNMHVEVFNEQLNCSNDVIKIIHGCDIVICVADRPKMEILEWVNEACVKQGIPLLTGGLDTKVSRYYTIIPKESGCLSCWRESVAIQDDLSNQVLLEQKRTQLKGDNAAFVTFVSLITSLILTEFTKIITGIQKPIAINKAIEIDFETMRPKIIERWSKKLDCSICGSNNE